MRPVRHRDFHDESSAGGVGVLHPDPPVVQADMLGHQGQSQPDAVAAAAVARLRRAAVEALEDALPVLGGDAGSAVLHLEPQAVR